MKYYPHKTVPTLYNHLWGFSPHDRLCRSSIEILVSLFASIHECKMHAQLQTCTYMYRIIIHKFTVSHNNLCKLLMSKLRQFSMNFYNFWQVDENLAEILWYMPICIFHLIWSMSSHYFDKHKNTQFLHSALIITIR